MTDQTLTLRIATPGDNILLAQMGARTFYDSFARENSPEDMAAYLASAFYPELQAAELADPLTSFLIVEADQIPVGYAMLRAGDPPAAVLGYQGIELVRIYCEKAWIGKGVGSRLMAGCISLAREKGYEYIWLGVWQRNWRAIEFYKKWGFVIVGEKDFQLGSDLQNDFVMQRRV